MRIYLSDYALDYIEDQTTYPHLTLELSSTGAMDEMMDTLRASQGLPTFFDDSNEDNIDDGWYDFYADVNLETEEIESIYAITFCTENYKKYKDWQGELPIDKADVKAQIVKQLDEDFDTSFEKLRNELRKEE